jgi:hypothetical protein
MARGIHRLPKVSTGPAMPDPSTPCGQATLQPFQGWAAAVFYPLGYPMPYGPEARPGMAAYRAQFVGGLGEAVNPRPSVIPFLRDLGDCALRWTALERRVDA